MKKDALGVVIAALAGWTVASNAVVILHGNLQWLIGVGALCAVIAVLMLLLIDVGSIEQSPSIRDWGYLSRMPLGLFILLAAAIPLLLAWSWTSFWMTTLTYLVWLMILRRDDKPMNVERTDRLIDTWVTTALMLIMAILSLAVSRPDLDDAFYVGVAAFAAGHPTDPLLAFDPMLVERSWPLIFPSYRFASYELLGGALAYVLSIPAATIMHVVLPPLFAAMAVVSTRSLAKEISSRHTWIIVLGVLFLTLLLGDMPRSPANFSFDRIFQGKAILLSIMIPAIYAISIRYGMFRGNRRDLYILACAYIASIGISNFGMLMAPLVGVSAALGVAASTGRLKRAFILGLFTLIPLPYLAWVAWQSGAGAALATASIESAGSVWQSVFGNRGQYVVAALLLLAPALAPNQSSRRLLCTPLVILFGVLLNPLLSTWIAEHITTPPVYWRVTWQTPVMIYSSAAMAFLVLPSSEATSSMTLGRWPLIFAILASLVWLLPTHTLRAANGITWSFATVKTEAASSEAADSATRQFRDGGRLLAPDAVAGVISMRESHPMLVSTRGMYLYLMRSSIPPEDYARRMRLVSMVNDDQPPAPEQLASDLHELDVRLIVTAKDRPGADTTESVLKAAGWMVTGEVHKYRLWNEQARPVRSSGLPNDMNSEAK